jgi:hypothetical protein
MVALAHAVTEITLRLNPRRRPRTNPRVIKRGGHSSYKIKKKGIDIGQRHRREAEISLLGKGSLS